MANQQVYQAYPQNKGTLIPGQTISVNNYTVQVERYLSQGGFAHVYLVRTPQPVYNTTHHVLKRIAVANESMLTDVKKEVDIMRLLKGHPNIVHLIDAAWHKLPNNTFEVFILMEFCPGGGIIDMMNRRLRERLTEAEILQIFVDVCEGVAYMHNSRPPLLHRDLKVENILQSSPTSFKLCDFGSATTVSNPPTNMQEIRAVEADLNRHTTLQYRAPEMVDVYSKRPVNEKSDIWALGVLLYKLCYYTTPFEEHGPLAILNVQYRIPPYPVYSQDMNMLIASMLREHGAQRPTVFELLNHIHRLRGTKSKFSYNVPASQPLVPHSHGTMKQPPPASPNPLEGLVTYTTPTMKSQVPVPTANQGIQARDRVLEAIAPMRRGRPNVSRESQHSTSRPASPQKSGQVGYSNQGGSREQTHQDFTVEQEMAWKAATERSAQGKAPGGDDMTWNVDKSPRDVRKVPKDRPAGFGDDFAENLWSAPDPNLRAPSQPRLTPSPNRVVMSVQRTSEAPPTSLAFTGPSRVRPKQDRLLLNKDARDKDAFEGLGLMVNIPKSAPTLGEARKLRTGLAMVSPPASNHAHNDFRHNDNNMRGTSQRPTPSPQPVPRYLSTAPLIPQSMSPVATAGSSGSPSVRSPYSASRHGPTSNSATSPDGGTIEARFPSLEELDAQFSPPVNALYPSAVNEASSRLTSQQQKQPTNRTNYVSRTSTIGSSETGGNYLKPSLTSGVTYATDGTRSEQVTGIAMRDVKDNKRFPNGGASASRDPSASEKDHASENNLSSGRDKILQPRPLVVRKRSSLSIKPIYASSTSKDTETLDNPSNIFSTADDVLAPRLPELSPPSSSFQDWLTGDDNEETNSHITPDIPIIRNSPSKRASLIENNNFRIISSSAAQHVDAPVPEVDNLPSAELSPTVSKFKRNFPAVEVFTDRPQQSTSAKVADSWIPARKDSEPDSSSADEGPEDPSVTSPQKRQINKPRGRQSSVHDLVYQYGGGLVPKDNEKVKGKEKGKEKETEKEWERPSSKYNIGPSDFTPTKSRPLFTGLVPPKSQIVKQKTPSPTTTTFKPSLVSQSKPLLESSERPQPPPLSTKPSIGSKVTNPAASARARPQSMFIFPSKSTDTLPSPTSTSNNLVPPPDSRPRATRRTSISDMVQLYEAIGSTGTTPTPTPVAPPTIHKPFATKGGMYAENSRIPNSVPVAAKSISSNATSDNNSMTDGFATRPQISKEFMRQADNPSRSAVKVHRKHSPDRDTAAFSQAPNETTPRARRPSVKAHAITTSISRVETPWSSKPPAPSQNTMIPKGSPRKPPISLSGDATASSIEEPQSSSPEAPYQGVGRLIDQWQKKSKSAEVDQGRPGPGKRGGLPHKRAGTIHVEDR
ncbi:hypothetical protein HYPSUDRAFT_197351 [Hypholoma sublateritium FD-334 SS-4]|uniref:non-specific serine/threonine protein kinase n=1 Tax=Hypholoma sublateritium (strain FD-334 SS-4) TaxID=945553 RepID=A0A0D2PC95_HYPSF|nr:hypothetical protein HYPSUDRAFT_197351 [Hypholoma sublateritium FD-334 SS-4]